MRENWTNKQVNKCPDLLQQRQNGCWSISPQIIARSLGQISAEICCLVKDIGFSRSSIREENRGINHIILYSRIVFSPGDGEWHDRQRPSAWEMLPICSDYPLDQKARKTAWQSSQWRAESFVPLAVPNNYASDEMKRTGIDLSIKWGSASLTVEADIYGVSRLNLQRWNCQLQNIVKVLQSTSSLISYSLWIWHLCLFGTNLIYYYLVVFTPCRWILCARAH